ncbi:MAG TPA: hypothetical protein VFX37_08080 [Pseudolabrys sp.]|nr:hypothetical protein [Pseudolabrys sp.]
MSDSNEPVAWTNEAQLGFLTNPAYAEVPMAMWAKQCKPSEIPLYAAPQPDESAALTEIRQLIAEGKFSGEVLIGMINGIAKRGAAQSAIPAEVRKAAEAALAQLEPHSPNWVSVIRDYIAALAQEAKR